VLAGVLSTAVSATIGVGSLVLGGAAPAASFGPIWLTWWLGDMGGSLVVTPLLVLWSTAQGRAGRAPGRSRRPSCSRP
jgi:integral membrane sensor domain MASE1